MGLIKRIAGELGVKVSQRTPRSRVFLTICGRQFAYDHKELYDAYLQMLAYESALKEAM